MLVFVTVELISPSSVISIPSPAENSPIISAEDGIDNAFDVNPVTCPDVSNVTSCITVLLELFTDACVEVSW